MLVIVAAGRLLRRNVNVLMDRAPADAGDAHGGDRGTRSPLELRRLRVREAGGAHFADVVIGIAPGAERQGHAAADRVEEALRARLPDADVVVHVEPRGAEGETRERVLAAALAVPEVREIHNLTVLEVDGRVEVSLHLKLPRDLSLEWRHGIAEDVERAILSAVPEVKSVRTHLEPLAEAAEAQEVAVDAEAVERVVREETGSAPRELRFVKTDEGIVVFLTVALEGEGSLAAAHHRASVVEERVRTTVPGISDVVVHTEP